MEQEDQPDVVEGDGFVDVCVGITEWQDADGRYFLEEDFKVSGEIWRVHLADADPFPSRPHAHCVGGLKRYIGKKLHLGTAELFEGTRALGRKLKQSQFDRLIELIRPKFPGVTLPIPGEGLEATDAKAAQT